MKKRFCTLLILVLGILSSCAQKESRLPDLTMKNDKPDIFFFDLGGSAEVNEDELFQGYITAFAKRGKVILLDSDKDISSIKYENNANGTASFHIQRLWQEGHLLYEKKLPVVKVLLHVYFHLNNIYQVPQLGWESNQYVAVEDKEATTKRVIQSIDEMLDDYMFKYKMVRHPKKVPLFYLYRNTHFWYSYDRPAEKQDNAHPPAAVN